jgi:integrase
MACIWKPKGTRNWCARFRGPDGVWRNKTTGTTDKTIALKMALELEDFSRSVITRERHRKTLDFLTELAGVSPTTRYTVKGWIDHWLANKDRSRTAGTFMAYRSTGMSFLEFIGPPAAKRDLESVEPSEVEAWLNQLAKTVTPSTARNHLKRLSLAFGEAVKFRFMRENPCAPVAAPVERNRPTKSLFSLDQVASLLHVANFEWKGMILCGWYTGLRLGDIASLKWEQIDLEKRLISVEPQKSLRFNRVVHIPIHERLNQHLLEIKKIDPLGKHLFKNLSKIPGAGRSGLSTAFHQLIRKAGIENPLLRQNKNTSEAARTHQVHALSFHSLRHNTNSELATRGVSEDIRKRLLGHTDTRVHRGYVHYDTDHLAGAIAKLPNLP